MSNTVVKKFRIKSRRGNMFFWVCVYENVEQMREAGEEHNEMIGSDEGKGYYNEALGMCHTYERFRVHPDGKEELSNDIGTIRLSKTHLGGAIVAHEIVHAALHYYRMYYGSKEGKIKADFGTGCNEHEEQFAHIYDELTNSMNNKMFDTGLWK